MNALESYLEQLNQIRGHGVAETSYYGPLVTLLNAVGESLASPVICVTQLKDTGAGLPDMGLFTAAQLEREDDVAAPAPLPGTLPARGAVEVKGLVADIEATVHSEQVARYLHRYGQVLVTNLRQFALVGRDEHGQLALLEAYTLAASEADFWAMARHPRRAEREHGERLRDYLARALLMPAPLDNPRDVAWFLASYAREARVRMLRALDSDTFPELTAIREALEKTLGIHFQGRQGDYFFYATLVQTLFYGLFSAWVLWEPPPNRPDEGFDWRLAAYELRAPVISTIFERLLLPSYLRQFDLFDTLNRTGDLLNRIDRGAFFEHFQQEHAVQYFYEPFLEAYDPELRKELGVWYTSPDTWPSPPGGAT